jgi:membrane protein DedA with SNARE-associated domain
MAHLVQFLVLHGYALLFFWLLAEQAALPIPSVPLLLACGALARMGGLQVHLILLYGLAACMVADNVWFQLGRQSGPAVLRFICRVAIEPDSCVRTTENAFLKYGLRALLVSKFIPGLNSVAAPLAGSSGAKRGRFLFFDSLGSLIWIGTFTSIGYVFSDQLELVAAYTARTGTGLILLTIGLIAGWIGWKFIQRERFLRKLKVMRMTPEELQERLRAGEEVLLVDLRSRLKADIELVPGALRISSEELAARHAEIPRDREIILFCS